MTSFRFLRNLLGTGIFLLIFSLTGCSKDDDSFEDDFYANVVSSAKMEDLQGIWSIFEVGYDGQRSPVPGSSECPRDFFFFSLNGTFSEFTFTDSYGCPPEIITSAFNLHKGIVELADADQQMVITEINAQKLTFRTKMDADEDGQEEVLIMYARRYELPEEPDVYSSSFQHTLVLPHYNKIRFNWQPYIGFNAFDRYEIYRITEGCGKENSKLIGSIEDPSRDYFIDEDPPVKEELCYYFKLYTAEGLLAESEPVQIQTDYLEVSDLQVEAPQLQNLSVTLNWDEYSGYYFSHYEITVRNFETGSGAGYIEKVVGRIENRSTTSFTDAEVPFFNNPVYTVYVYDIFGNKSNGRLMGQSSWKVEVTRPEIIPVRSITTFAVDPAEEILYLYAPLSSSGTTQLFRYNYATHSTEVTAEKQPVSYPNFGMKIITSPEGKELFFPEGGHMFVYNAADLKFKTSLRVQEKPVYYDDIEYLGDGLWALTDSDNIFICTRQDGYFKILSQEEHFSAHQGFGNYEIVVLQNRKLLVGHENESGSIKYEFDNNGLLINRMNVPVNLEPGWQEAIGYSQPLDLLVNYNDHSIWSTTSFGLVQNFEQPLTPTSLSRDKKLVLGTGNDPEWFVESESLHQKKAYTLDLVSGNLTSYETRGYPHFVFENHLGELYSISSGLIRKNLNSAAPGTDIFVEKIR